MDPPFLAVLEHLVEGRMGLCVHDGAKCDGIMLRELFTGQTHLAWTEYFGRTLPKTQHKEPKGRTGI